MIATHNIKVNGRWYTAGEEVPEQQVIEEVAVLTEKEETAETKPAKEETEQKPKASTTRRRTSK